MAEEIKDGTGTGKKAKVDANNFLHTFSVVEDEQQFATSNGESYNINTGWVNISDTTAMIYFKNNEETDFVITAIAAGLKEATVTNTPSIYVLKNPTAGTIISGAVDVDINENRNFGSSQTLKTTSFAYKGTDLNTFTDGSDVLLIAQTANGRLFAGIDIDLPKGSSVGVRVEPDLSAGTIDCYVALIGYVKNANLR